MVLGAPVVADPLAEVVGALWTGASPEPEDVEVGVGEAPLPLLPPEPVPARPCLLLLELRCERLWLGAVLAGWEQFCFVPVLASFCVGRCLVVELGGGHVGVVAVVVVVLVDAAAVVFAGAVVLFPGADELWRVVLVVGAPGGAVLAGRAAPAAVLPPIQPFSALEMASVLASSDSRLRQPTRVLWARSLRCTSQTFG